MKKLFLLLTLLIFIHSASAEFWACFTTGQHIDFCNPAVPDRTCDSASCRLCMDTYNEASDCYIHGNWNVCNTQADQTCSVSGGGPIDSDPPRLTVTSPSLDNSSVFTSLSVPLVYSLNEKADVSYLESDGRGRWIKICHDCIVTVQQSRRFDEGENKITVRATDVVGNAAFTHVTFFIDSKDPRILSTKPKQGYASGEFHVEFSEANPAQLLLYYGNPIQSHTVDLNTCQEVRQGRVTCDISVDLTPFDSKEIEYWITLIDVAGNLVESRHETLHVDVTPPIVNSLDYRVDGRSVEFDLEILEENFEEVTYVDHTDARPRERSLCRRLTGGICHARTTFKDGLHNVELNVLDEAGNAATEFLSFFTDSSVPRITRTNPKNGFADGNFDIELREENPAQLILQYGNSLTGFRSAELDIESACISGRRGYSCNTFVDLDDYDSETITYWFGVEDIVGNSAESNHIDLEVDTTAPMINDIELLINGRRTEFLIDITEDNFDEVTYLDHNAPRPRERRLCSRLTEGVCMGRASFSIGPHEVSLQITDEAGNAVGESVSFTIS